MKSIRWKIIALCAAVIVVPLALLNYFVIQTFDEFARRDLEKHMKNSAWIVGENYLLTLDASDPAAARAHLATLATNYSAMIGSRIELLDASGIVLLDTATNETSSVGQNYAERREVTRALGGNYGARFAMTDDRQLMFYFVAQPVARGNEVVGVVYVSRHTNNIIKIIKQMVAANRVATALTLLVGLILAWLLATYITKRLRKLTADTAAFARGDALPDFTVTGRDEVAELARSISSMATEIQRTNRYNREFISTVSHELKMPITAIKGAAELLEAGAFEKPEARTKFIGNIRFEADRLAQMAGELNELTRIDTETARTPKERVDLGKCVQEIVARLVPALEDGPQISVTVPDKPLFARIVPNSIAQVIGNLLDNAQRYTPANGRIEVIVAASGREATVTVRDNGSGIDPANLEKIFDRFFTTEPKDKRKDYGRGLGLAIARSIIESHGGKISVTSKPNEGAAFTFTLPLA